MAKASNMIIAGDYKSRYVEVRRGVASIGVYPLDKSTVESYEVIEESSSKSATSAVGRAAVGAFLLGPVGLAAGLSAKNNGIHTLAVYFKDGKKSLMEVDDKVYRAILAAMF